MKVSVVTDSISSEFFFPIWYKYYGSIFGFENLHVITHVSEQDSFESFALGSLGTVENNYDDDLRLKVVQHKVQELLGGSDAVIRVDTDEIIAPDPAFHPDFASYLSAWSSDYITARGFDVFQSISDQAFDPALPALGHQRKLAFANAAMNKTCIIRRPVRWNRGFHCIDGQPELGSLLLFHLKRLDIDWQIRWNAHVASRIQNDAFIRGYYETARSQIEKFHHDLSVRSCVKDYNSVYRDDFIQRWKSTFAPNEQTGTLDGEYIIDTCNIEIPERFWGLV